MAGKRTLSDINFGKHPARPRRPTSSGPKMAELAERINTHLKRFEDDPTINVKMGGKLGLSRFWFAGAWYTAGAKINVRYISFQNTSKLSKAEAEKYLVWLDAGNVGRHYEALRDG